ncbi:MAG: hypothetical protein D6732_02020 [Methanobacteriota archaeon]|nr:MAG: hypothetical protein D6732_02020 [Euryarchaeota archaeon]
METEKFWTIAIGSLLIIAGLWFSLFFDIQTDSYDVKDFPSAYEWDFSSVDSMTNGLGSADRSLIYFKTSALQIIDFSGEENYASETCSQSSCTDLPFSITFKAISFFLNNVSELRLLEDMDGNKWDGLMAMNPEKSYSEMHFVLPQGELTDLPIALAEDLAAITNFHNLTQYQYRYHFIEVTYKNNTGLNIELIFDDGTQLIMDIVGNSFFLKVEHFMAYYSKNGELILKPDGRPQEYYFGLLGTPVVNYVTEVNDLISLILDLP